jgi:hypothetical protein
MGLPRNSGRSSNSTETKNASISTWRMQAEEGKEVEEVEEFKEVVDEEHADPALESRLARKVTNFGMAAGRNYAPGRIRSEAFNKAADRAFFVN